MGRVRDYGQDVYTDKLRNLINGFNRKQGTSKKRNLTTTSELDSWFFQQLQDASQRRATPRNSYSRRRQQTRRAQSRRRAVRRRPTYNRRRMRSRTRSRSRPLKVIFHRTISSSSNESRAGKSSPRSSPSKNNLNENRPEKASTPLRINPSTQSSNQDLNKPSGEQKDGN